MHFCVILDLFHYKIELKIGLLFQSLSHHILNHIFDNVISWKQMANAFSFQVL